MEKQQYGTKRGGIARDESEKRRRVGLREGEDVVKKKRKKKKKKKKEKKEKCEAKREGMYFLKIEKNNSTHCRTYTEDKESYNKD